MINTFALAQADQLRYHATRSGRARGAWRDERGPLQRNVMLDDMGESR